MSGHYLSASEAKALSGAGVGVIEGVMKLAAHGLKADAILAYAEALADGNEPAALPAPNGPRPLTLQLHSFLADPRQYRDTYSLDDALVNQLRSLELSDKDAAKEGVLQAVSANPRVAQSGRPVRVVFDGSPGDAPGAASPLANASSINSSLAAEIASNSMRYGAYKFEAFETTLGLTQRFAVDIGQNFFAVAFSKRAAVSIARIASVKGRGDPAVESYIVYVNSAGQMLHGRDIPSAYWSCIHGPRDPVKESDRSLGAVATRSESSGSAKSTIDGK